MSFTSRAAHLSFAAAAATPVAALATGAALPLSSLAQQSPPPKPLRVRTRLTATDAALARPTRRARRRVRAASHAAGAPTADASGASGWAIPTSVVMCESGGRNVPSSGGGPSGYYQITSSTWQAAGGSGSAAYEASKAEQDAVARRIWAGGSGASNWTCAGR